MADAIDFLFNRPIGRTQAGEDIFADRQFLLALLALRDRTGGAAANFIADALAAAAAAEATADGKIDSYWQASAPTGASEGDLWFDTDDGNRIYQFRSGAWVNAQDSAIGTAISAAAGAQITAEARVRTWFQTYAPTPAAVGDLWHDTDDAGRRTFRWNGTTWTDVIADQTPFNTAAAIASQGALATASSAAWSTQVSGKPSNLAALSGSEGINNALVAFGSNAVIDHGWTRHADSALWTKVNTSGASPSISVTQHASGVRYYATQIFGGAPNNSILGIYGVGLQRLSVSPGDRIEASCYVSGGWLNSIDVMAFWWNAAGVFFASTAVNATSFSGGVGSLASFTRVGGFHTALTGAAAVSLAIYGYTANNTGNPYLFLTAPFLARARADQTVISDWSPGFDAQPGADITGSNTAAAVLNQSAWATSAIPTARLQYINDSGRLIDGRGYMANAPIGSAAHRDVEFVLAASSSTQINVTAHTDQRGGVSTSMPGASITGLAADTRYDVFRDVVYASYVASIMGSTTSRDRFNSQSQFLYIGGQRTQTAGGGYSPPPPPPPGGGGGYHGDWEP
jgi:hypothetical protein